MSRIFNRTALLMAAAVVSAAALAAPAAQAQSATKPGPCTDFTIKDPKGDQVEWPTPGAGLNATTTPGPDSVDARGVFFNYKRGADGKPVLTANLQVTNLVTALPEGAQTGSVAYFIDFSPAIGGVSWVEAITDGEAWTFNYGKVGTPLTTTEETTGKAWEGPDGVLEIVVPADPAAAKPGAKIEGITASISYDLYPPSDDAPDEGTKTYTITECPAAAGAPAPSPDPAPATSPPPPAPQPNAGPT